MATDRTITLAARDGKLFVLSEMPGYFEPPLGRSWYALGLRAADYEQFVGCALGPTGFGETTYRIFLSDGRPGPTVSLPGGGKQLPEFHETTPIAPPKQRGKALQVRWMNGRWEKLTARGWRLA